jgi:putative transposase
VARKLRIQHEGAIYHVINRGNYRHDVFASSGAAQAFALVIGETCALFHWRLHAYVIMRNHYHLALETPEPNLVEGMHWLQSTFATRFNRLRSERGHLFQGRYQALLIEDGAAVLRVANYIHLNPVRAGLVAAEKIADFRWSSLYAFARGHRPKFLVADHVLGELGYADSRSGWKSYVDHLIALAADPVEQRRQQFSELSKGWAIGTDGWRKALAKDHAHLALAVGVARAELQEIKNARHTAELEQALRDEGKTSEDVASDRKGAPWKIAIAARMRATTGASHAWIAEALRMGSPSSVRVYLST